MARLTEASAVVIVAGVFIVGIVAGAIYAEAWMIATLWNWQGWQPAMPLWPHAVIAALLVNLMLGRIGILLRGV